MEIAQNPNIIEQNPVLNNNENFAEFLSENLAQSGISQQEISYLLNLIPNPQDNLNRHSMVSSISSVNSFYDSEAPHLSMINSTLSRKSVLDNQNDMNIGLLSDFS